MFLLLLDRHLLELGAAAVREIGTARVAIDLILCGRQLDLMNPDVRDWCCLKYGAVAVGITGTTFVVV